MLTLEVYWAPRFTESPAPQQSATEGHDTQFPSSREELWKELGPVGTQLDFGRKWFEKPLTLLDSNVFHWFGVGFLTNQNCNTIFVQFNLQLIHKFSALRSMRIPSSSMLATSFCRFLKLPVKTATCAFADGQPRYLRTVFWKGTGSFKRNQTAKMSAQTQGFLPILNGNIFAFHLPVCNLWQNGSLRHTKIHRGIKMS